MPLGRVKHGRAATSRVTASIQSGPTFADKPSSSSSGIPALSLDWLEIAGRIRGLIRIQDEHDFATVARRLGVSEPSLRMSVDIARPMPTVDVIAALVRIYGLDPSWVLTGHYDASTHRMALQSDMREIAIELSRMLDHETDAATPKSKSSPHER